MRTKKIGEMTSNKEIPVEIGYGPHLMLDGYGCDEKRLDDIKFIYAFLSNFPKLINMRKIMPPYVFYHDGGNKPEDRGFSGIVIIAESHISIHTYPSKGFVVMDIFSCKEFDTTKAVDIIVKAFNIEKCETKITMRGREFPKNIELATQIVKEDRTRIK